MHESIRRPHLGSGTINALEDRLQRRTRIALADGRDERALDAAAALLATGHVEPLLVGDERAIAFRALSRGIDPDQLTVIDPVHEPPDHYIEDYCDRHRLSPTGAAEILQRPLFRAAAMVHHGDADALMGGCANPTRDVLLATDRLIGGDHRTQRFGWDLLHGVDGSEVLLADCAVTPHPTSAQLAEIAAGAAHVAQTALRWPPRVALLSFATHGSSHHPDVSTVTEAVRRAHQGHPTLALDGDLQVDAALDMAAALQKTIDVGPVAGQANVLVFPDLNAADIAARLSRACGGARLYGTILSGFHRPACTVSRSTTPEEMIGAALLLAACAEHHEHPAVPPGGPVPGRAKIKVLG